jgi:peptide-methionine (S)-S-oxide reductase
MRFTTMTTRASFVAAVWLLANPAATLRQAAIAKAHENATIVLAGGCFWGTEAVFEHLRGVQSVTSVFARYWKLPSTDQVPIEAVRVVYDPAQITYHQLLEVFFSIAHDPTSRDRQGPDVGPEYRAVVFYEAGRERAMAEAYVTELVRVQRFARPIVTEVRALTGFEIAPTFHQDYAAKHPADPYILHNDAPKLVHLKKAFPELYADHRAP